MNKVALSTYFGDFIFDLGFGLERESFYIFIPLSFATPHVSLPILYADFSFSAVCDALISSFLF
jgi:hypothetical protein